MSLEVITNGALALDNGGNTPPPRATPTVEAKVVFNDTSPNTRVRRLQIVRSMELRSYPEGARVFAIAQDEEALFDDSCRVSFYDSLNEFGICILQGGDIVDFNQEDPQGETYVLLKNTQEFTFSSSHLSVEIL
jgi:hypothetical protein